MHRPQRVHNGGAQVYREVLTRIVTGGLCCSSSAWSYSSSGSPNSTDGSTLPSQPRTLVLYLGKNSASFVDSAEEWTLDVDDLTAFPREPVALSAAASKQLHADTST